MRLSELGEAGLLAELERRALARAIADDVAVLRDGLVVTHDLLVEEVHFRREWTSWRDLGYKAAAVNLSDLAAAGARPEALLVGLAAPGETRLADLLELYEGLNETGVPVVGGDTNAGERVVLAVTALGRSPRVPGRGGAEPGDLLVVTGPLGASAGGLHVLRQGLAGHEELVRAHRRPPYRLDAGEVLAPVAHALVDLSDGIVSDAARVAARSGCRLEIAVERLPLAPGLAGLRSDEPFWAQGEDYELLAALAPDEPLAGAFSVVGRAVPGEGVAFRERGRPLAVAGWSHFG